MGEKSNTFLETEPVGRLMRRYAVPCVISLVVAALYNVRISALRLAFGLIEIVWI